MIIGGVIAKGGGRLEWFIPQFSMLPQTKDVYFRSPVFDAEGERWFLRIEPNGTRGTRSDTQIRFTLKRYCRNVKSISCTVGVRRADHSEEAIGTETSDGGIDPSYIFNKKRRELKEGGWLPDGHLTVTLHFRGAHALQEDTNSIPRDIRGEQSASAIDQDSRRDVISKPPEAKANREVTSRETQTDVLDVRTDKDDRLGDFTSTEAKGVEKLRSDYKKLLNSETDSDLLVVVSGREFRAHKGILRSRSPVFDAMFKHETEEKQSGKVVIEDLNPDAFRDFLEYLYTGRMDAFSQENVYGLYAAADKYDVQELKSEALDFMQRSLSVESFCDVMALALRHLEHDLLDRAVDFFKDNLSDIIVTVKWQVFMKENTTAANEILVKASVPKKAK